MFYFTFVERPKFTLSPVNSTDDDIICMDNKSDMPTVLCHTSIIGMYKTHHATIAYYVYFSFLAKYSPVYGSNIIRSITVTGQEGIWHLLHGEHHMKCQEVANRMEDDL